MKKTQNTVKIIENKKVKGAYYKIILEAPVLFKKSLPGQFAMLKVTDGLVPLLRRPLGVHAISGDRVEFLYEVLGEGTRILSERKPAEYIDIIGPLGNGFNYQLPVTHCRVPLLIAGGMGVAPLVFLAEKLRVNRGAKVKIPFLLGAKTKDRIVCVDELKKHGCQVEITTDDGSQGYKGRVTELLDNVLSTIDYRLSTIYACGPKPMLKAVCVLSKKYLIPAQVSLEEHMACGIGACLGCVVSTRTGYARVCKDGPVFPAEQIVWQE